MTEIEQLKAERNEAEQRLAAMKAERNALQAQLAQLRELCDYWIMAGQPGPYPSKQEYNTWLALGYHSRAWNDTAQVSLARLKAEVLEQFLSEYRTEIVTGYPYCHQALEGEIKRLRAQAEEE